MSFFNALSFEYFFFMFSFYFLPFSMKKEKGFSWERQKEGAPQVLKFEDNIVEMWAKYKKQKSMEENNWFSIIPHHVSCNLIHSYLSSQLICLCWKPSALAPNLTNCICFDRLGGIKKPHTCDISICDNTVRLLDLFPGCAYSCLCDKLDVIFFLKQLRAIKRSLMMILG